MPIPRTAERRSHWSAMLTALLPGRWFAGAVIYRRGFCGIGVVVPLPAAIKIPDEFEHLVDQAFYSVPNLLGISWRAPVHTSAASRKWLTSAVRTKAHPALSPNGECGCDRTKEGARGRVHRRSRREQTPARNAATILARVARTAQREPAAACCCCAGPPPRGF
jgi:hypothetical protein